MGFSMTWCAGRRISMRALHESLWELGIGKLVPRLLIARADHHVSIYCLVVVAFQRTR